jgi:deoxyhypusine synthase
MKKVKDISVSQKTSIKDLVKQFSDAGGFTAKKLADGAEIWNTMLKQKDCVKFFSFPACICATGTRGIIKDMIKNKKVDVIIATCGMIDHDLARIWKYYCQGTFDADDKELHKKGINRLGNVFVPNECYGEILEDNVQPILEKLYKEKKEWCTRDLLWAFGKELAKEKNREESILYWAWKNKIPIFIPGPTDGSWGSQMWMFWQTHKDFKLNLFDDEQELANIVFDAKKSGALMIGGGISKHHTIWWNQFRGGLDYAIQITTAPESDGSLSGARTREAISWGKLSEKAKHVTIEGDATVLLPLLIA